MNVICLNCVCYWLPNILRISRHKTLFLHGIKWHIEVISFVIREGVEQSCNWICAAPCRTQKLEFMLGSFLNALYKCAIHQNAMAHFYLQFLHPNFCKVKWSIHIYANCSMTDQMYIFWVCTVSRCPNSTHFLTDNFKLNMGRVCYLYHAYNTTCTYI